MIARAKTYISHASSFLMDSCGRRCALLKPVEKDLVDLIRECAHSRVKRQINEDVSKKQKPDFVSN